MTDIDTLYWRCLTARRDIVLAIATRDDAACSRAVRAHDKAFAALVLALDTAPGHPEARGYVAARVKADRAPSMGALIAELRAFRRVLEETGPPGGDPEAWLDRLTRNIIAEAEPAQPSPLEPRNLFRLLSDQMKDNPR